MSEKVVPGPVQDPCGIREAVCIHTKKIYDSCKDKDCIEDLRFYPTRSSQAVLDRALSVRGGRAELLYTYIDVEPAGYNRGFYTVDIRYYYRITADAIVGAARPLEVCGLAVFHKRVLLFGSEGSAKIFSSRYQGENAAGLSNLPEAVVEAVDPIVLNLKLVDPCDCGPCGCPPPCPPCPPPCPPCPPSYQPKPEPGPVPSSTAPENDITELPPFLAPYFESELGFDGGCRRLYVTLGQFSIVRLERDSQLLIPVYDYCLPTKECSGREDDCEDDPCEIFRQIRFPVGEFFPPSTLPGMEEREESPGCGCK